MDPVLDNPAIDAASIDGKRLIIGTELSNGKRDEDECGGGGGMDESLR